MLLKVEKCGLEYEGVDWAEVGKHLAVCLSRQELEQLGISEVVPKRKGAERKVTMAYLDGGKNKKNTAKWDKLWDMPQRLPTRNEKSKMIAKTLEIVTKEVMSKHYYAVGNTVKKQTDGGPIGLQLTGAVARVVMLWWDKKFLEVANTAGVGIDMYERFVDDSNLVSETIEAGWEFCETTKRMKFVEEKVQEDNQMEDDRKTALVIKHIANSIHPMIQMEEDYPSNHSDGKLPILDLKCSMNSEMMIKFEHYEKPLASRLVLSAQSALPMQQKRNIHINECVRRLRNCAPEMEWDGKKSFIQDYVVRLYHAGYSEKFRLDVVRQALARYDGMLKADRDGLHPLYRERDWQDTERRQQKRKKKTNWLSRGGYDTVIMVNPTPGGELARQLQKVVMDNPGPVKIKIQEQGGTQIKSILQRTNPNRTKGCAANDCLVCKHGRGKGGECRRNNIGYILFCDECGADEVCYVGETGQNAYTRGLKHMANYRGKQSDSPLWKHAQMSHQGSVDVSYSMKVEASFRDPLTRQVNEAVRIANCKSATQLNSKAEWHGPATVRLVAEGGGWG